MNKFITLLALLTAPLAAQEVPNKVKPWKKAWRVSQALLVASHGADAATSWQRPELNPILRNRQGKFGGKGLAIKVGIGGGWIALQEIVNRNSRHGKTLTIINLAATGVNVGVAATNRRRR